MTAFWHAACLRLLEHDGTRRFDDCIRHFFSPVSRQAVHENRIRTRLREQPFIDLVGAKNLKRNAVSASWPMLVHTSV